MTATLRALAADLAEGMAAADGTTLLDPCVLIDLGILTTQRADRLRAAVGDPLRMARLARTYRELHRRRLEADRRCLALAARVAARRRRRSQGQGESFFLQRA